MSRLSSSSPCFSSMQQERFYCDVQIPILILMVKIGEGQTLLISRKAALALPILTCTSASVPPPFSAMLPRYVKHVTPSSASSYSVVGVVLTAALLLLLFFLKTLLLPQRTFRPKRTELTAA